MQSAEVFASRSSNLLVELDLIDGDWLQNGRALVVPTILYSIRVPAMLHLNRTAVESCWAMIDMPVVKCVCAKS